MAVTIQIGSALETASPEIVAVGGASAATNVTVKNVAGPTLAHHTDQHTLHNSGNAAFTTTAGNSQVHNQPLVWLVPSGATVVTLTGSIYGS